MSLTKDSTLLILDDDEKILEAMELALEDQVKSVISVNHPEKVIPILQNQNLDLLIMDMNYSRGAIDGKQGLALLKTIRESAYELPVIVMTAYGEIELVVECMKMGANDFIQKPWSNQRLLVTITNALQLGKNKTELATLKAKNNYYQQGNSENNLGMIGSSNAMNLVRDKITRIAHADANVLILGENGTGKELVAQAIHQLSGRNAAGFIKIDLGSIHEQLFESEMFGAKKGAYTGLNENKIGRIALADKGTLFLDEIGNLPLSKQAKMLSALQNREIIPVGATKAVPVDVRVVSATNLTMNELLNDENFRQDLLYRINTIELYIPPLRERKEDIPELLHFFKSHYEKKYNTEGLSLHPSTTEKAQTYDWPGNVRELQHAMERAVLMCSNGKINPKDLIPSRTRFKSGENETNLNLEKMEKKLIEQALQLHKGNMTKASKELGITRTALYRRLEKHNL